MHCLLIINVIMYIRFNMLYEVEVILIDLINDEFTQILII